MGFDHAIAIANGSAGQDRATAVALDDVLVVALADGAGGTGRGAAAAQALIDAVTANPTKALDATPLLFDLDDPTRLGHGQTTAVVVVLTAVEVRGASVGDSGAWLISGGSILDVTRSQERKPLLGGGCTPVAFQHPFPPGSTLLVASDGLFHYAKPHDIARIAASSSLDAAAHGLIDLVRLPSGALHDDVSIVLCRQA